MGLLDIAGGLTEGMKDLKELSVLKETLAKGLGELEASGRCPAQVKAALGALDGVDPGEKLEESMDMLKNLAGALKDHADSLPENLQEPAKKFLGIMDGLDQVSGIQKLFGK